MSLSYNYPVNQIHTKHWNLFCLICYLKFHKGHPVGSNKTKELSYQE